MHLFIKNNVLVVQLSFWERVWSFHRSFAIPREHIGEARAGAPKTSWKEIRVPGTFIPWVIKAGTYYTPRGKEFWHVTRKSRPITIELSHEKYRRLVLGVADAEHALGLFPTADSLAGTEIRG
jgi:hypothetical protein